jgi:hypothetical protein
MHGLDVFRMVISPGSSHSFGVSVCDLKHNFAVWQRYALNGADVLGQPAAAPFTRLRFGAASRGRQQRGDRASAPYRPHLGASYH